MKKKVVVIGSGIGGLGCGALLAAKGFHVTVLERHPFSGGRSCGVLRDGYACDFGVHMFSQGDAGPLGELNRRTGGGLEWVVKPIPCRVMGRVEFDFPLNIMSLGAQIRLARRLKVRPGNLWGAYSLLRHLLKARDPEILDRITLRQYVDKFTKDPMVHLFMNCLAQLYFALSYQETSAGEFMWCFSRMFRKASFGYPRGGAGAIPQSQEKSFVRHGGAILHNQTVKRIVLENNRVKGVETESGLIPADIVISNAGMLSTVELAGKEHFEPNYVQRARTLRYSNPYVTVKYALNKRVIPYPVVFHMPSGAPDRIFDYVEQGGVPEDPFLFVPVPSNHDPELAPPGGQLVIAGAPVSKTASPDLCDAVCGRIHEKMRQLFPALERAALWQSRTGRQDVSALTGHPPGGAIGLGQFPFQTGKDRPGFETGVQGLYLVGADAGSRGIGTELAAGSALGLAEKIITAR